MYNMKGSGGAHHLVGVRTAKWTAGRKRMKQGHLNEPTSVDDIPRFLLQNTQVLLFFSFVFISIRTRSNPTPYKRCHVVCDRFAFFSPLLFTFLEPFQSVEHVFWLLRLSFDAFSLSFTADVSNLFPSLDSNVPPNTTGTYQYRIHLDLQHGRDPNS